MQGCHLFPHQISLSLMVRFNSTTSYLYPLSSVSIHLDLDLEEASKTQIGLESFGLLGRVVGKVPKFKLVQTSWGGHSDLTSLGSFIFPLETFNRFHLILKLAHNCR